MHWLYFIVVIFKELENIYIVSHYAFYNNNMLNIGTILTPCFVNSSLFKTSYVEFHNWKDITACICTWGYVICGFSVVIIYKECVHFKSKIALSYDQILNIMTTWWDWNISCFNFLKLGGGTWLQSVDWIIKYFNIIVIGSLLLIAIPFFSFVSIRMLLTLAILCKQPLHITYIYDWQNLS